MQSEISSYKKLVIESGRLYRKGDLEIATFIDGELINVNTITNNPPTSLVELKIYLENQSDAETQHIASINHFSGKPYNLKRLNRARIKTNTKLHIRHGSLDHLVSPYLDHAPALAKSLGHVHIDDHLALTSDLSHREIDRLFKAQEPAFSKCKTSYPNADSFYPKLRFSISDHSVKAMPQLGVNDPGSLFERCALKTILRMRFPTGDGPLFVEIRI